MPESQKINKLVDITSETLLKNTGSDWNEWIAYLDRLQAYKQPHGEIVKLLIDEGVQNNWWRQKIASGYRLHKGLRKTGQSERMFQAGVSKVFPFSMAYLWDFITAPDVVEYWNTGNESTEELKSFKPPNQLSLNWYRQGEKKVSVVFFKLTERTGKATLHILHTALSDAALRDKMKRHWKEVMLKLYELATTKPKP